jgi:hypothetical protein
MERFARADLIRAKVDEWRAVDTLDAEQQCLFPVALLRQWRLHAPFPASKAETG